MTFFKKTFHTVLVNKQRFYGYCADQDAYYIFNAKTGYYPYHFQCISLFILVSAFPNISWPLNRC